MNEPIINPWIFYFAEVANVFKILSLVLCFCIFFIGGIYIASQNDSGVKFKDYKKVFYKILVGFIITLLIGVFTPSKDTLYCMAIAQKITPANIETMEETGKDFIDYITEKVKETHNE